jgi:hypothetical protein
MATTNTQVTTYLPDHILEYVEKYCIEYGITRKKDDKPLLATGIVDLLNILVNTPIEDLPRNNETLPPVSSKEIEDSIEKKLTESKVINNLLDTLLSDSTLRQKLIDGLLPVTPNTDYDNTYKTLPDTLPVTLNNEDKNTGGDAELLVNESTPEPEPLPKDESNPYGKSLVTEALAEEVIVEVKEDSEIKSLEDAIEQVIIPMLKEEKKLGEIEKILEGKYLASSSGKSTKWKGCLSRLVKKMKEEGKV